VATGLENLPKEKTAEFGPKLLDLIASKTLTNEENEYRIRKALAAAYSYMEEPIQAARVLANMHLEQIKDKLGVPTLVEAYVTISDYYLDAMNNADAYSYITKAAQYIDDINDIGIICRYKYCYAQVHDANLKFGQAASLYYELSQKGSVGVPEEETKAFLEKTVICTILAPPGTQRSRLLTMLYKDDRTRITPHYNLLEKMYLERLIKMEEVTNFEEELKPHQKGLTSENYTVLQKAVLEHNILALSKIYTNISFDQLTKLLQITLDKAELLVASMINEGKIKAHISQADRFVYFEAEKEMIQRFNELISNLCEGINQLIQETSQKYTKLESIAKA
jgi:COP9 signalosome complex subunit 4